MSTPKKTNEQGFRALLVLGAVVSIAIGVWGLVWQGMLDDVLGLKIAKNSHGVARLFGAVMLAVGIGYALAAAQPQRSRSLLVQLFAVPGIMAIAVIAGTARGEIKGAQGVVFAIYNLAYCLLYFRVYPRIATPEPHRPGAPPGAAAVPPRPPPADR